MLLTFALGVLLQARVPVQVVQTGDTSITPELARRVQERIAGPPRRRPYSATPRPVTDEHRATAFKDSRAKSLLERARVARMSQDSALLSYDVNSYQRISAGLGFSKIGRDRLIFRTEHSGRIRWHRDVGAWIDVTGARTALPGIPDIGQREAGKGLKDASGDMLPVPYYPGYEALWAGPEMTVEQTVNDIGPVHPLAEGSEAYYTYSTGDSIVITLPDKRVVHLRALNVRPRETKWNLMVGSLWFDEASGQLVRAAYRFATPMHIDAFVLEQEPDAFDDVPAWVKPMMMPMKGEISAVSIEYGMYGGGFWLPRARSAEGVGTASFMRVPFKVEQSFKYHSVNALDSLPRVPIAMPLRAPDSLSAEGRRAWRDSVNAARIAAARARRDSARAGLIRSRPIAQCDTAEYQVRASRKFGSARVPVATRVPCNPEALVDSPDLPKSIFDPGDELFDLKAREALIGEALSMGAQPPFTLNPANLPRPNWTPYLRMMRYNRVEGLSAGAEVNQELGGGYSAQGTGRFGIADREPNFDARITRTNLSSSFYLSGYKRLVPAGDWGNPLSFGSSLSAFLFGRDEGFYYRSTGVEFGGRTERGTPIEWRLFAERQRGATPKTAFSLGGNNAAPNISTFGRAYYGSAFRVRHTRGLDPNGFRIFSDLRLESALGDSIYGRGALDLTITEGFGHYAGALTLSGGSSVGFVPTQRLWYLGGTHTVRGQSPDTARSGNAFWLARAEVGRTIQGTRPVVFTDIGWVGDRTKMQEIGRPMSGVGAGASLLDGLIRFDIARGLYPRKQWRVDLYVEAIF